jgi:hypothetical protein
MLPIILALLSAFVVLRILYRLTLHPLARIPGPRAAAATSLWTVHHDLVASNSLVKDLPALHKKYGENDMPNEPLNKALCQFTDLRERITRPRSSQ